MPSLAAAMPRITLPPPITTQTWTPSSCTSRSSLRGALDHGGADAEAAGSGELLAGELDEDPAVGRLHAPLASSVWPSRKRSKASIEAPPASARSSPDGPVGILHEGLIDQTDVRQELGELPLDDAVDDLLGLALLERLLAVDLALLREQLGGHALAGHRHGRRVGRRHVHRDVLGERLELRAPAAALRSATSTPSLPPACT